jgi:2-C-methyl-D-erythritol 4-phosphate cytidylyltransferase
MKYWAVVVAAGDGTRLGTRMRKAAVELGGKPLAAHSALAVCDHPACAGGVLVVHADDLATAREWMPEGKPFQVIAGGASRRESVQLGVAALRDQAGDEDLVAIHDGARPLLHRDDLQAVWEVAAETGAALLAEAVTDTLHRGDDQASWDGFVDRDRLWRAQTPQIFQLSRLSLALQGDDGGRTDEVECMVATGQSVQFVQARHPNLKITTPADLLLAQLLLESRPS